MRTLLLLGVAAGSLLLAGHVSATELPMTDSPGQIAHAAAAGDPSEPGLDYGAPQIGDARVYTGRPDRVPSEGDYRHAEEYEAQGRWTGTWNGTYENPEGARYRGTYEGTYEGRIGTDYSGDDTGYYDESEARELYWLEQSCRASDSAAGTIIGGLIGGVAGNRIAGRGDRVVGTILGGVIGAGVGRIIEQAADKQRCRAYLDQAQARYHGGGGYYQQGDYYRQGGTRVYHHGMSGYGYGYNYGYYSPGVVVTTVITTGAPVVTETIETTTTTSYVKAPVRKRHVAKKKWKPKPKPRCVC